MTYISSNREFSLYQKDVNYTRSAYKKPPKVFISASHSTSGGNAPAECNGIVSWIEVCQIITSPLSWHEV